jgi:hypothetical protein
LRGLQRIDACVLFDFKDCLLNDCCLANSCVGNSCLRRWGCYKGCLLFLKRSLIDIYRSLMNMSGLVGAGLPAKTPLSNAVFYGRHHQQAGSYKGE